MRMSKDIANFLEFPKNNILYSRMADEALDILFNIELLYNNKLRLDFEYHNPNSFTLELNNLIRNCIFLVEKSNKSSTKYPWLKKYIDSFLASKSLDYSIIKKIRDNSHHQELFIADGTIEFGLYKIISPTNYRLKIGMGDFYKKREVASHYLYTPTMSFFHKILLFHQLVFIDNEHAALNECLGVTRRWLGKVKFKDHEGTKKDMDIDIYNHISKFTNDLIQGISEAFKMQFEIEEKGIVCCHLTGQYNFVNTILELDLYPEFFSRQWGGSITPINYKYHMEYQIYNSFKKRNKVYIEMIEKIPSGSNEIIKLLYRYSSVSLEDFANQDDYSSFVFFITSPELFLKNIFRYPELLKLDINLIMKLKDLGLQYLEEIDTNFEDVDQKSKDIYFDKFRSIIKVLLDNIREQF